MDPPLTQTVLPTIERSTGTPVVSRATRKLAPTGFRPTNLQALMTRDQRRNVYSGHPSPISLRETPKCLSAVNWIQGLFSPAMGKHLPTARESFALRCES